MDKYRTSAWLVSPDGKQELSIQQGGVLKGEMYMPEGTGTAEFEAIAMMARDQSILLLSSTRHSFNQGIKDQIIETGAYQAELPEPELLINTARSGHIRVNDNQAGKGFDLQGHHTTFHHAEHLDFSGSVHSGVPIESRLLRVPVTDLSLLLGEALATKLMKQLRVASSNKAESCFIPPYITAELYKAQSNQMTGPMRQTFAMAKTLEYLCLLADHVCNAQRQSTTIAPKIHRIYEELLHLEGKLPSVQELAVRYGASAKAISNGFKELYGTSLFSFVTEQRLKQAHVALLESDVPLKVLAFRLGYSTLNHFVTAFKRQFGYTPGNVRKNGVKSALND